MKISIMLHTQDYRGDHSADINLAVEHKEGETVAELMTRAKVGDGGRGEYLEIRLVDIEA